MPAFSVDESIDIHVPAAKVKDSLLDFRQWPVWSPWICAEPDCKIEHSDDGKSYSWDGKIIGAGRMQLRSSSDTQLQHDLEFFKPFKSKAQVDFQILAQGSERTKLHWRMQSALPFFMFFMVKKMAAMIAGDYRRGLALLKDHLEMDKIPSSLEFVGVADGFESAYVGLSQSTSLPELGPAMRRQLQRLAKLLEERGQTPAGPSFCISQGMDILQNRLTYTTAVPLKAPLSEVPQGFVSGTYRSGKSYQVIHRGAYRHLGNAWAAGMMHGRAKLFASAKDKQCCEVYIKDPQSASENECETHLHFPAQ